MSINGVSVTVILVSKDKKVLIVQRSKEKSFPGKWVVPGGKVTVEDGMEPNTDGIRYYSAEARGMLEVHEETGISILGDLKYLCTMTLPNGRMVVSYYHELPVESSEINVTLNSENMDYRWVTRETMNYDYVAGMDSEIMIALERVGG